MSSKTGTPETVRVVAPSTLNEGYVFDVVAEDGRTYTVTVPNGGVKAGETFDAINPTPVVTSSPTSSSTGAPTGEWRTGLFSCFETCVNGPFWMAFCCPYIAIGQLLQRMKMTIFGGRTQDYSKTCMIWTILFVVSYILYLIIASVTKEEVKTEKEGVKYAVIGVEYIPNYILALLSVIALTRARYYMRQKWRLPAECCETHGCLSDCCVVYWCTCCSVIQMMRHTHDEKVHRYDCCAATGLEGAAPDVDSEEGDLQTSLLENV